MEKEFNKKFSSQKSVTHVIILVPLIFLIFISILSCGINQNKTSIDFPDASGYVNDFTKTLSDNWINQTEQLVQNVEEETSCEIVVAVINSLEGYSIEEYAAGLFNEWGIGKKDKDNGVLLLVALSDRKLRIEVGYGLEGVITDLQANLIIEEVIIPRFSSNKYESGIYNGVIAIVNTIHLDRGMEQISYSDSIALLQEKSFTQSKWFVVVIILSVLLPWILIGVISGSFRLRRYIKEHRCPKCKKIGLLIKQKILISPTYDYPGKLEVKKYCKYCGFKEKSTNTILRLNKRFTSGSSLSGFSSSDDNSNSSSSSSSGFGGGSSGGAGASGSW